MRRRKSGPRDGRSQRAARGGYPRGRGPMLIALLADIHANHAALAACLADARARGAERLVFVGDYVGYGAEPERTVEAVRECVDAGALALLGNHDRAVADPGEAKRMNRDAATAIAWTRNRLDAGARGFLAALPMTIERDDLLFVHADASAPARWIHVEGADEAKRSLGAVAARVTFVGHVHVPAVYGLGTRGGVIAHRPVAEVALPLTRPRRWLVVLGSVGQPLDGVAAAGYALFDPARAELVFRRVPYDAEAAAARIRAAGLPAALADRLLVGR